MKFPKLFSKIQEAPWYRSFLNPVINEIGTNGKLLDIGTGSGKLIEILSKVKEIECVGTDTSDEMILEAKIKLKNIKAKLLKIDPNTSFPFESNYFDYITICSVLFLMKRKNCDFILKEAQRVLKRDGRMIVLTPTGNGNFMTISKGYFSLKNISIYAWYYATKNRSKTWTKNKYLKQYAFENKLNYKRKITMAGFSQLEIISK